MNESIASAFLDELEKIGVTQAWVRGKLKPKGKGKFSYHPRLKYIGGRENVLVGKYLESAEKHGVDYEKLSRKQQKTIQQNLSTQAASSGGIHHKQTGTTRVGGRGSHGQVPTGMPPREIYHHEMFHRRSPVASGSETAAHFYGALKSRPKGSKLKHVIKSTAAGARRDVGRYFKKFVEPVGEALIRK